MILQFLKVSYISFLINFTTLSLHQCPFFLNSFHFFSFLICCKSICLKIYIWSFLLIIEKSKSIRTQLFYFLNTFQDIKWLIIFNLLFHFIQSHLIHTIFCWGTNILKICNRLIETICLLLNLFLLFRMGYSSWKFRKFPTVNVTSSLIRLCFWIIECFKMQIIITHPLFSYLFIK